MEKGQRAISLNIARKLAHLLDVSFEVFLGRK
jgi:DNA-binding XRE family transcriptional regulator